MKFTTSVERMFRTVLPDFIQIDRHIVQCNVALDSILKPPLLDPV